MNEDKPLKSYNILVPQKITSPPPEDHEGESSFISARPKLELTVNVDIMDPESGQNFQSLVFTYQATGSNVSQALNSLMDNFLKHKYITKDLLIHNTSNCFSIPSYEYINAANFSNLPEALQAYINEHAGGSYWENITIR